MEAVADLGRLHAQHTGPLAQGTPGHPADTLQLMNALALKPTIPSSTVNLERQANKASGFSFLSTHITGLHVRRLFPGSPVRTWS